MEKVSVIVPCYNEEEVLYLFDEEIRRIASELKKVTFEFVYINDGSKDKTLEILKKLAKKDERVKYVSFSRNFGKEAGIYAGLKASTGDYAVVIDADLQHDPNLIVDMYKLIKNEKYDSVAVKRVNRKGEPIIRSFCSKMFYKFIKAISKIEVVDGETDYRMMSKTMVDAVLSMSEYNRFSKGIFSFVGFNTKWLEQENIKRVAGTTKWSFKNLIVYSIEGITAFSTVPLAFASFLGLIFCFISFLMIVFIVIRTLIYGDPTAGWPSLVCIIFLVGGIQLFCLGIMGNYLSKTYLETKKRPIYIVKESNCDKKDN